MKLPWTSPTTAEAGERAEAYVGRYLERQGLALVATNYRCRRGELDLVARDGELLVFVEVRLRNHQRFASGAESVDLRKQRRLIATAQHFLQARFGNSPPACRFDVAAVTINRGSGGGYHVEWLKDAFRPGF
jgi:putative endonuclease